MGHPVTQYYHEVSYLIEIRIEGKGWSKHDNRKDKLLDGYSDKGERGPKNYPDVI